MKTVLPLSNMFHLNFTPMVRNLKSFIVLVILLQFIILGSLKAQQPGPPLDQGKRMEEHFQRMKKDLNLTEDQAQKLKAAMEEQHKVMEANKNASEDQRKAAIEKADKAFMEKAKTFLTAEQFAKLKTKEEERKKKGKPNGPPERN